MGYGGDFNDDVLNLYNFCADGLVSPEREPHSSLYELKNVYAPINVDDKEDYIQIQNRYSFISFKNIDFKWKIEINGQCIKNGSFKSDIMPEEVEKVENIINDSVLCLNLFTII